MNSHKTRINVRLVLATAYCIAAVSIPRSLPACMGSRGPICSINPSACLKSMTLTKSVPSGTVPLPFGGPAFVNVTLNLFITCPATNNCGAACPRPSSPSASEINVSLYGPFPGPASCPPPGPLPPPAASRTISSTDPANPMILPGCSSGGSNNTHSVGVDIPPGTPPGAYCVVGTANVTFSDGTVLTQTGDTMMCLVESVAGQPKLPRLSLELVSESFPRMAPGDQAIATYRVTNNDRSNSVRVIAFSTSRQAAVRPQGGNEARGVFAISSPFGDDFPIQINPGTNCIPLPDHPYAQPEICGQLELIEPGKAAVISVGIRSYGQCASGSCSESTLRVEGVFSDGTPALACAGMALIVDTSMKSKNWGSEVNDCNQNDIPDAVDIATGRSKDVNFNALPDECEEIITVPISVAVAPTNPPPLGPIRVQIAFNENPDIPMVNVWADGIPLVRRQSFGFPFWSGTIAADARPGPQTVYFLGKDRRGGLTSFIGLYTVQKAEGIPFAGFTHAPIGAAKLRATSDRLVISNLGKEGQDGVCVRLGGDRAGFGIVLEPVSLAAEGASLGVSAVGDFGGNRNAFLGTALLVQTGGVIEVTADYRSTGDPNVLVEVWNKGSFVGGTTVPAGRVGSFRESGPVIRVGKFGPDVFPYCIPIDFLREIAFLGVDGSKFAGTQLRLLSPGSPGRIQGLSAFFLQAGNVGESLTILNEFRTDPLGLSIARLDRNVVVSWSTSDAVLEATEKLGQPFAAIAGAASPYVVPRLSGQEFFRLRRQVNMPAPPGIVAPEPMNRFLVQQRPDALPKGATAQLPGRDGDPVFVSFPVRQQTVVSSTEAYLSFIVPLLQAINFSPNNPLTIPENGIDQPRGDFNSLVQSVQYEYDNNPEMAGRLTKNMLAVFLGQAPPDQAINSALLAGEGMTYSQFVAGIERQEIQYPFRQVHQNVPIEHTLLIASRWGGQHITSVFGSVINHYSIGNQVVLIIPSVIVQTAIMELSRVPGIACDPGPFYQGGGPDLMLLPYGSDNAGNWSLRYAYRLILGAHTRDGENAFLLWLDAQTGQILRMEPLGFDVSASGRTYNRDPGLAATTASFTVDAAAAGQYVLKRTGVFNRLDYRENGYNAADVSISSAGGGSSGTFANFNQAPINDVAQALTGDGSNKGFQQVNLFGTLSRHYNTVLGLGIFTPYPFNFDNPAAALAWTPAAEVAGYCNANGQFLRFGACQGYFDPAAPNFTTGTIDGANLMNFAHDNTIIAHELGHSIMRRFTNLRPPNWCGAGPCQIPVGWINLHDLADFWADHFESCNCAAGWVAKNMGGVNNALNCAPFHDEGGGLPRLHQVTVPFNPGTPGDHFPEHRSLSTHAYGDGQIGTAALWQVRLGMRSKCRPSGLPQFAIRYARAIRRTGFYPAPGCDGHGFPKCGDSQVYPYLYDLLQKMVDEWANSGSPMGAPAFAHNGPHTTSKVTAGFAKAGIFLIPLDQLDGAPAPADNGGDAVIDIDDNTPGDDYTVNGCTHPEVDFLRLGGVAPTFHVWTGPRYRLSGAGGAATLNNPSPCNSKFRVEVSTVAGFPAASTINSDWTNVDTNPATAASPEGYGAWMPTGAQWATLQAGGAGTRIYYRARTRDAADGNERISTSPGNGLFNVPPPYAVLTANGQSDY